MLFLSSAGPGAFVRVVWKCSAKQICFALARAFSSKDSDKSIPVTVWPLFDSSMAWRPVSQPISMIFRLLL